MEPCGTSEDTPAHPEAHPLMITCSVTFIYDEALYPLPIFTSDAYVI